MSKAKSLALSAILAASSAYCAYNPKPITPIVREIAQQQDGRSYWTEEATRGMALGFTALFSIPLLAGYSKRRREDGE